MTTPVIPGTQVVSRAAPPSRSQRAKTGTWHLALLAERGPTDAPRLLANIADYDKHFGGRVAYGMRDAIEAHFRNGGSLVNAIRIVGPAATKATVAFAGAGAALSLSIEPVGEGASTLTADIDVDGATFTISVFDAAGVKVDKSPPLASPADAANWSVNSAYIRVLATGAVNPVATGAPVAIAGGNDDRAAITDADRIDAINRIPKADGPGQVSIPGATTLAAQVGLASHARLNNRFAILDAVDSTDPLDLIAQSDALRAGVLDQTDVQFYFLVEGWHNIPGLTAGTTRVVPPSAIVSAMMARRDALTLNPNDPAAGVNGVPSFSLGIARPNWTDDVRGDLNEAGVNVFRQFGREQRLYGYRTGADANDVTNGPWVSAGSARLRMAIQDEADRIGEPFVFSQITKTKIAEFNGALAGMLLFYYGVGALFGDSPQEAFVVDTGPNVNTPDLIAQRHLSAVMGARMSEFAEVVYMEFVKIPVTEVLAA